MDAQRSIVELKRINQEIGSAESRGDVEFLKKVLAEGAAGVATVMSVLAFRRASGACVDALGFLGAVKQSNARTTQIEEVRLIGQHEHKKNGRPVEGEGWSGGAEEGRGRGPHEQCARPV